MKNTLKCPHCGKEIEVTDALTHQIEEQVSKSVSDKHRQELEDAIKSAEDKLRESVSKDIKLKDLEIAELQKKSKEKEEELIKKTTKAFEQDLKQLKSERDGEKDRNDKLSKKLDDLLEELKSEKRRSEEMTFELKKKFLEDEDRIRADAAKKERERADLDIKEMRKKLEDTEKALAEAQIKAKQGSQQLQGEVLELDLEEKLKNNFLYDEIIPVGKGVQGADILQIVKNQTGKAAGIILWETKRAKWSPTWIPKLKEDGRKNDATMVVLVCESLPPDIENFKVIDGVIVTSRSYALSLSPILRRNLMLIAQAKSAATYKDERLELLYNYLQSDTFRNRFESFSDGIKSLEEGLLTEKRSMERIWKHRSVQLERMRVNTSRMFGELQGVMQEKLATPKSLELDSGTDQGEDQGGDLE